MAGPTDRIGLEAARGWKYRPVELGEQLGPQWATFWFRVTATARGGGRRARRPAGRRTRSPARGSTGARARLAAGARGRPRQRARSDVGRRAAARAEPVLQCLARGRPRHLAGGRRHPARAPGDAERAVAHEVHAIGHAHIDTAWLWPIAETHRKCVRSYASALAYMERYPGYRFSCSGARHLAWMRDREPELYGRIRSAVTRGQFVPVGGDVGRARLQPALRRVAGTPVPATASASSSASSAAAATSSGTRTSSATTGSCPS